MHALRKYQRYLAGFVFVMATLALDGVVQIQSVKVPVASSLLLENRAPQTAIASWTTSASELGKTPKSPLFSTYTGILSQVHTERAKERYALQKQCFRNSINHETAQYLIFRFTFSSEEPHSFS